MEVYGGKKSVNGKLSNWPVTSMELPHNNSASAWFFFLDDVLIHKDTVAKRVRCLKCLRGPWSVQSGSKVIEIHRICSRVDPKPIILDPKPRLNVNFQEISHSCAETLD